MTGIVIVFALTIVFWSVVYGIVKYFWIVISCACHGTNDLYMRRIMVQKHPWFRWLRRRGVLDDNCNLVA